MQHLLIFYSSLNEWRTGLSTDNSIAATDSILTVFSCGFSFPWLFGRCLRIRWVRWIRVGELHNITYKQCNDGRALGLSHMTSHMSRHIICVFFELGNLISAQDRFILFNSITLFF